MRSARWMVPLFVTALAVFGTVGDGLAEPAEPPSETRPLFWQVDPDGAVGIEVGDEVEGSEAAIWRDEDGVSFRIDTTGLVEGHGYTVWLISHDNPDACVTGDGEPGSRCTTMDMLNPATFSSLIWGRSGKFVEGDGTTTFTGRRSRPDGPCVTEPAVVFDGCEGVLFGHGLHNPLGAEIHFVLRDHGPPQEGLEEEQTSTINGGCDPATHEGLPVFGPGWGTPGDYACHDPQAN